MHHHPVSQNTNRRDHHIDCPEGLALCGAAHLLGLWGSPHLGGASDGGQNMPLLEHGQKLSVYDR